MKIASWNVNSLKVRMPHLEEWLALSKPDIVALQEIKMETKAFPVDALRALGYESIASGQKTYNGVALLARAARPTSARCRPPSRSFKGWQLQHDAGDVAIREERRRGN